MGNWDDWDEDDPLEDLINDECIDDTQTEDEPCEDPTIDIDQKIDEEDDFTDRIYPKNWLGDSSV